jgi:hypothetical protein
MQLVEMFLPLTDNAGSSFPRSTFASIEKELAEHFGGVTSYPRAPALGLWKQHGEGERRDDLIIYEVMAESVDAEWWKSYREKLEKVFKQDQIVVRSHQIRSL